MYVYVQSCSSELMDHQTPKHESPDFLARAGLIGHSLSGLFVQGAVCLGGGLSVGAVCSGGHLSVGAVCLGGHLSVGVVCPGGCLSVRAVCVGAK
jgi:hypothetical protein